MPRTVYPKAWVDGNDNSKYNPGQQGVFSLTPASTPKYLIGRNRDAEYKDTMARMFLDISGGGSEVKKNYLDSLPKDSAVIALAKVLIGQTAAGTGTAFIDFFLQRVDENFEEKVQVTEVLSNNYVAYFFGQAPPIFTFAGALMNTYQDDHRIGMAIAYQHLIRGTACAQRGALLRIRYDSVIVSGSVLNMTQTLSAGTEMIVPFGFRLLVKEYRVVNPPLNYSDPNKIAIIETGDFFEGTQRATVTAPKDVRRRLTMTAPLISDSAIGIEPNIEADDPDLNTLDNLRNRSENADTSRRESYKDKIREAVPTVISV